VPIISYAQRFEDLCLMRCFGLRSEGFYIDIGSGHPVYDNMSFAFYLQGWRGVTVEPNPWLARLSRAVRPRDRHIEAVIGPAVGEATFHLVDDFHGLSTMIESHARSARMQFGKASQAIVVPMTTLEELCERHAPGSIDFLKVDVEGAEQDVLLNGNWQKHRPKVVIVEALAPYTLAPAWQGWEPFLEKHGYRYVWFDSLNRYYLAEEAGELAPCFEGSSSSGEASAAAFQFRNVKPALVDETHPDHRLAVLIARTAMIRLPLLGRDFLCQMLTADVPAAALEKPAGTREIAHAIERTFGPSAPLAPEDLKLPAAPCLRDVYAAIIETDQFCAACGRISASYAW
jgi:FkbM family methyltransferase